MKRSWAGEVRNVSLLVASAVLDNSCADGSAECIKPRQLPGFFFWWRMTNSWMSASAFEVTADAAHRVFLAGPFQGQALQGHEADCPR